ncbi:MAG: APC family permease [Archangiaceae bacterium]|nr:APC family permease [Archangiaceae bacterium]
MTDSQGPGTILLAWVVGAVLALCGVVAYSEVARLLPKSGGEYQYLSRLLHPFLGYLAGWTSLLIGFSAPIAVDAYSAGSFVAKLMPWVDPRWFGVALVALLTVAHAVGLRTSARVQNALFVLKVIVLLGFVTVGVVAGRWSFPTWSPTDTAPGFPTEAFAGSLFWIAFAFSGWNAAVYAAEEFRDPARHVPRAMLVGCGAVALLYLVLNYVFVANLLPSEDLTGWGGKVASQITLGHVVMDRLAGPAAARVFSGVIVVLFLSAMSAMMLVGPRVYAAMAADGVLPAALRAKEGKPPMLSVVLQGVLATAIIFLGRDVRDVLGAIGALLVIFAALTMAGLFRAALDKTGRLGKPSKLSLVGAGVYCLSVPWMVYFGFFKANAWDQRPFMRPHMLLLWAGLLLIVTSVAYALTRSRVRRPA